MELLFQEYEKQYSNKGKQEIDKLKGEEIQREIEKYSNNKNFLYLDHVGNQLKHWMEEQIALNLIWH